MESAPPTIAYASTTEPSSASRVWAAALLTFVGLGLIVIGGCFLIGVMCVFGGVFGVSSSRGLTSDQQSLVMVLYALSVPAFAGGVWVLVIGLNGLRRVLHG